MKRILYVEDNEDVADAVKLILNHQGFDTTTANCGKKGLELAREGFDLVLLDIMLPDMSGWDIYEKLKDKSEHTKFAFLSAIPVSTERMAELKKAGVSDYIMKPFEKSDLIKRIKFILEETN
ncbi:MAG: response regulator transcription factor [Candidatus Nanoarchaeia archaeon]